MNYPLVSKYLGYIAMVCGVTMLPPLVCALWYGEGSIVIAFGESIAISAFVALALFGYGRKAPDSMHQRESLALVGLSWILAAALGAFPYLFSGTLPNPIDAFFESMSGFTTTGSTVLQDIEATSRGILFWRSMTQWLGGIGITVLFVAVLPYLGAGGKQIFKLEAPGPESKTFRPRVRDTAKFLWTFYVGLSSILFVLLWLEGMTPFEAICHTFSTMSTGGFSTRQGSLGAFDSVLIEMTVVVFIIISATNFGLFFAMLRGQRNALWKNTEFRVFLGILTVSMVLITLSLMGIHGVPGPATQQAFEQGFEGSRYEQVEVQPYEFREAVRRSIFQTTAIMTGTGFVTDDFDLWPHFSRTLLLVLMLIGGCGASTSGGIKVARVIMLVKMAYWQLERSFRPKTIRVVRLGDAVVEDDVQKQVAGFLVLYLLWFILGALVLSAHGLPFETATAAVIATMNNIGPGLGLVGANMDYALLPPFVKIFLSFCMVLGRLEIFTICVMLIPSFWRSRWTH